MVSRLLYRALSTAAAGRTVPLSQIKELRARTGAPVGTVKAALEAHANDIDAAAAALRRQGAALAAKRASTRDSHEGLVGTAISGCGTAGALVELRCETDFVARTPRAAELVRELCTAALNAPAGGADALGTSAAVADAAAALREALRVPRARVLRGDRVAAYAHAGPPGSSDVGRIGVLVALSGAPGERLATVGRRVAMHVAASSPTCVSRDSVAADDIARERDALRDAAMAQGKRPDVVERIVDGRMDKWFGDVCLLEQEMLVECDGYDGKPRSVAESIDSEVSGCTVIDFDRFSIH